MTNAVLNMKISKVEDKIHGLVTTTAFNTKIEEVENKIQDVSGLVKKPNDNAKISNIQLKYSTTSDYLRMKFMEQN